MAVERYSQSNFIFSFKCIILQANFTFIHFKLPSELFLGYLEGKKSGKLKNDRVYLSDIQYDQYTQCEKWPPRKGRTNLNHGYSKKMRAKFYYCIH